MVSKQPSQKEISQQILMPGVNNRDNSFVKGAPDDEKIYAQKNILISNYSANKMQKKNDFILKNSK
jgi:hypothetical protein